jgi:hypothetical protein
MQQVIGLIGMSIFWATVKLEWWYSMQVYQAMMGEWGFVLFGFLVLLTLYVSLCFGERFPEYSLQDHSVVDEPQEYERKLHRLHARRYGPKKEQRAHQVVDPRNGLIAFAFVELVILFFSYRRVYLQIKAAGGALALSQWGWQNTTDLFIPALFYVVEALSGIFFMYALVGAICRLEVNRKKKEASTLLKKRDDYATAALEYWDAYRNQGFPAYNVWAGRNDKPLAPFIPPNRYLQAILRDAGRPDSEFEPPDSIPQPKPPAPDVPSAPAAAKAEQTGQLDLGDYIDELDMSQADEDIERRKASF